MTSHQTQSDFYFINRDTSSFIELLVGRLERISADSAWAHRASGVKGSLLKMMEQHEKGHQIRRADLMLLIDLGFYILKKTAKENNLR